jgi:hypothetical protein
MAISIGTQALYRRRPPSSHRALCPSSVAVRPCDKRKIPLF